MYSLTCIVLHILVLQAFSAIYMKGHPPLLGVRCIVSLHLVMDEVTRDIQGDIPWCMLFADDVVLVDESRTGVNQKLELYSSKSYDPRLSRNLIKLPTTFI